MELGRKEAWLEEEADQVVDAGLRAAREMFESAFKELANAPKPFGPQVHALRENIDALLRNTSVHRRRMKFLGALRKNGVVYVPRLGRRCQVKKIDHATRMSYAKLIVALEEENQEVSQRHLPPYFLGHFSPVLRRLFAVLLRFPASWRQDGENGRKMA